MPGPVKIKDMEVAKMLLDPRRLTIIDLVKDEALTVTQMAAKLEEKPSRLYYHVRKLEEAGVLKVVETRQHGNLVEKYYKAVRGQFTLDESLLPQFSEQLLVDTVRLIEPGLKLLGESFKKGETESDDVDYSIMLRECTKQEWKEHCQQLMEVVEAKGESAHTKTAAPSTHAATQAADSTDRQGTTITDAVDEVATDRTSERDSPDAAVDTSEKNGAAEEEKKERYVQIVLSYRIGAAEELGCFLPEKMPSQLDEGEGIGHAVETAHNPSPKNGRKRNQR